MNPGLRAAARHEAPAIKRAIEEEANVVTKEVERREALTRAGAPSHTKQFVDSTATRTNERLELKPSASSLLQSALQNGDSWKPLAGETIEHLPIAGLQPGDAKYVNRPHLLAAFPTDEAQYQKVYGSAPTAAASAETARLARQLGTTAGSPTRWTKYPPSAEFREVLRDLREADLVVVVAHAEDTGATIVLPNGRRVPYLELHLTCSEMRVRCVVLSCHSIDLSISTEVSTVDAISMWSSASKAWELSNGGMDADSFVRNLREARLDLQHRREILLTTVAVSSAITGTAGYELVASRQR